jgi:hypothetical protein
LDASDNALVVLYSGLSYGNLVDDLRNFDVAESSELGHSNKNLALTACSSSWPACFGPSFVIEFGDAIGAASRPITVCLTSTGIHMDSNFDEG